MVSIKDIYSKFNLHIQVGVSNCGPTSLLNVLRLSGRTDYDEDELARLCKTNLETGTENEDLVATAKAVGLEVVETKDNAQLEDIYRHVDAGVYVIVNYCNPFSKGGHYSPVVEYAIGLCIFSTAAGACLGSRPGSSNRTGTIDLVISNAGF